MLLRQSVIGVEDFVVVSKNQPAKLEYDIALSGVAGLRLVDDVLELVDAGGSPRLRVARPWLMDSAGTRRRAHVAVHGCDADTNPAPPWGRAVTPSGSSSCTLLVSWDPRDLVAPLLVDPAWQSTTSLMVPREAPAMTSLSTLAGDFLFVTGEGSSELVNLADATTSAGPAMSAFRRHHSVAYDAVSNMVYAVGGVDGTGAYLSSTERVGLSAPVPTWSPFTSLPEGRADHVLGIAIPLSAPASRCFVVGGKKQGGLASTNLRLDLPSGSWQVLPGGPGPRTGHALVMVGPKAGPMVIAGFDASGNALDDVWSMDKP